MESLSPPQRQKILEWARSALKKDGKPQTEDALLDLLRYAREKQRWDLDDAKTLELLRPIPRPQLAKPAPQPFAPAEEPATSNEMTAVGLSKQTRQDLREVAVKGQTYDEIIKQLIASHKRFQTLGMGSDSVAVRFERSQVDRHEALRRQGVSIQDFEGFVKAAYFERLADLQRDLTKS